jgi:hypothetical protein
MEEKTGTYRALVGKPEERRPLGRPRQQEQRVLPEKLTDLQLPKKFLTFYGT